MPLAFIHLSVVSMTVPSVLPAASPIPLRSFGDGFSWKHNWYPMAFAEVTDKSVPHRLELFGEPLVLWWDTSADAWAMMSDTCPHRLAPLSEGRVDEYGRIECPYHGWAFTPQGACTKIPQADHGDDERAAGRMLSRCHGTAYATVEKQGLIWVYGDALDFGLSEASASLPDESRIPTCEAMEDPRFVWVDVSRDMPYSADMLLENVLDSSHVPFTHHQTISRRENAVPLALRLTEKVTSAGFCGEQAVPPPLPSAGVSSRAPRGSGAKTERTTVFCAPTYMHHKIRTSPSADSDDFDAGFETWTVAYATPTGPGRCRLFARFPFRFPPPKPSTGLLGRLLPSVNVPRLLFARVPDWMQHMGQLKVLDDDNIFLPLQERRVGALGGWRANYVMPTPADTYVSAYRRWFDAAGPPPHAAHARDFFASAPLSKADLLDRYAQHTAHCTSCAGALRNAKKASVAARSVLLAIATTLPWMVASRAQAVAAAAATLSTSIVARHTTIASAALALLASLRPFLGVVLLAGSAAAVSHVATLIESRLTSGLGEYPPPRNKPDGARGSARELRTVEEGRRS